MIRYVPLPIANGVIRDHPLPKAESVMRSAEIWGVVLLCTSAESERCDITRTVCSAGDRV